MQDDSSWAKNKAYIVHLLLVKDAHGKERVGRKGSMKLQFIFENKFKIPGRYFFVKRPKIPSN